jgi:hypothetical protein
MEENMNCKCDVLSEVEQKSIFAGAAEVPMSPLYLTKTACEVKATALVVAGTVKNISIHAVAQEIFAHACCYYGAAIVKGLGVENATVDDIYRRANPVNIDDGLDTPKRVAAYILIWNLAPDVFPL